MQGQRVPHVIESDVIIAGEGTSEVKGSLRVYGKLIVRDEVQGQVPIADKWTQPITLALYGDAEGQTLIDGSTNVQIQTLLVPTGVAAGNYGANATLALEVGADGRIKAITATPITTLAIPPSEVGTSVAPLVSGKVPNQYLPDSLFGGLNYAGVWDAATNTPALSSGVGSKGTYYKVSVAGSTVVDSMTNWGVGDFIAFNGSTWDKIDGGASEVTSVAGRIGAVVLTKADVGLSNADNTSDLAKPISTATQTALDGKAPLAHVGATGTAHGAATASVAGFMSAADKAKLDGIAAGASGSVQSVAGKTGVVTLVKADVGLGNVDNTSDLDKPVSTATQTALNFKLNASGGTIKGALVSVVSSIIQGTYGGTVRGSLYNDDTGFGFVSSAGNWAARVPYGTSDLYVTGNVTAYSDERLKSKWEPLGPNFTAKLALVKYGSYFREDLGVRQLGVSAQSLRRVLPEAVSEDDKGMLSVAYGNAALVSVINLAVEFGAMRSQLQAAIDENKRLEVELRHTQTLLANAMRKHEEDCGYVLEQLEIVKRKIK